ncbi:transposase [Trichonephila clavipes]|nr:transposase [Trichonephila clavipes]
MAQHRPRKLAPVEYSTDEEDMIVYDVEENEIESNPDYDNGQEGSTVYLARWKGIIYYELLLYGQILNSDIYCQQLDRLKLAIDQNWPTEEVCSIRTSPGHTSVVTRQKLWELGRVVLMHPPHNLDVAPSDYHLFLALKNLLNKKLESRENCENRLLEFFANKDQCFYERSIMRVPLKWQQIIQQNGAYLTQIGQSEAC